MADGKMNIDTGRAYDWSIRVNEEIARTSATLKEVTAVCNEFPGDNDVIMKCIESTGNKLNKLYEDTADAFQKAWGEISRGIAEFSKVGEKIGDSFEDLKGKFNR